MLKRKGTTIFRDIKFMLTKAQENILSVIVSETLVTKGARKGNVKSVIDSESFDWRSFKGLITKGYVRSYSGSEGDGWVATDKAVERNLI